jgi:hypothetical protein
MKYWPDSRARSVPSDLTRLVLINWHWTLTGNDRTRSGVASGVLEQRIQSLFDLSWLFSYHRDRAAVLKHKRPCGGRCMTGRWRGVSNQPGRHVRSARRAPSLDPNGSICLRGSINRSWPVLGSLSWHFDILDILVSLSKHLTLISIIDSSL